MCIVFEPLLEHVDLELVLHSNYQDALIRESSSKRNKIYLRIYWVQVQVKKVKHPHYDVLKRLLYCTESPQLCACTIEKNLLVYSLVFPVQYNTVEVYFKL